MERTIETSMKYIYMADYDEVKTVLNMFVQNSNTHPKKILCRIRGLFIKINKLHKTHVLNTTNF